jgi:hypothetical protein
MKMISRTRAMRPPNRSGRRSSSRTLCSPKRSSQTLTRSTSGWVYVCRSWSLSTLPSAPLPSDLPSHWIIAYDAQANVMLAYKLAAAVELLTQKLAVAEGSLGTTDEDLEFLREQITVMEVNTARVYNWDVKRRRERRAKESANPETLD